MTFLESVLALLVKLAPFKGAIAVASALLLTFVLVVMAIHLPTATLRVYPAYGAVLIAFFTGFFLPRPTLPI